MMAQRFAGAAALARREAALYNGGAEYPRIFKG
jgi:hypothetical protein